jgi:putative nucleotidyltransferase-like protein
MEPARVGQAATGVASTGATLLWDRVGAVLERAPDFSDLQAHRLHLLAAHQWRERGRELPAAVVEEERLAALRTLLAPLLLAQIRKSCDGRILLMKGAEVALSYPDAALRPYRDVDILVDDAPAVQRSLLAAGFEPVGQPDAYYEGRHHLRPLVFADYPLFVEVHSRPEWPKWTSPPSNEELFAAAGPSELGIDGVLALHPATHAVVLTAHSWSEVPLRRALDVLDAAALAEHADRDELAATARRWGLGGVWKVTEEAARALFLGERTPSSMRIWARDLLQVRDRTVLENHVRRIISPFWVLPFHRALAVAGGAAVAEVRPSGDEPWTAKLDRARRALRNPLRQLSDHDRDRSPSP